MTSSSAPELSPACAGATALSGLDAASRVARQYAGGEIRVWDGTSSSRGRSSERDAAARGASMPALAYMSWSTCPLPRAFCGLSVGDVGVAGHRAQGFIARCWLETAARADTAWLQVPSAESATDEALLTSPGPFDRSLGEVCSLSPDGERTLREQDGFRSPGGRPSPPEDVMTTTAARRRRAPRRDAELMNARFPIEKRPPDDEPPAQDSAQVSAMRRRTRVCLVGHGLAHLVDAAELVVSELVSNAIQHSGGCEITVVLALRDGFLRIVVRDGITGYQPVPASSGDADEHGRGLFLVQSIAHERGGSWGTSDNGAATWCELAGADARSRSAPLLPLLSRKPTT
ncbi:ATPase [Streptomyces paromomycinus]|uniref:ATPase n=3 Tax=Streptomyces paromomycinus TaxID=92743 RepID=A0A401VXK3_STREY|nr:ATPase [Streptomyces paromomycinus]